MMRSKFFKATFLTAILLILSGCGAKRTLLFAEREWDIDYFKTDIRIFDRDTTFQMSYGGGLIPYALSFISSSDSVKKYPGMDKFLGDILHTCHLDGAEILYYNPQMQSLYVLPKKDLTPFYRPSSVYVNMQDERPFGLWVYDDDVDKWGRKQDEMYTYVYLNKRKRQLLIVNLFDYGDTPIAQITVCQKENKMTRKMNVPGGRIFAFYKHDLRKLERDVEFWAHTIEGIRPHALATYKLGEGKKIKDLKSEVQ